MAVKQTAIEGDTTASDRNAKTQLSLLSPFLPYQNLSHYFQLEILNLLHVNYLVSDALGSVVDLSTAS